MGDGQDVPVEFDFSHEELYLLVDYKKKQHAFIYGEDYPSIYRGKGMNNLASGTTRSYLVSDSDARRIVQCILKDDERWTKFPNLDGIIKAQLEYLETLGLLELVPCDYDGRSYLAAFNSEIVKTKHSLPPLRPDISNEPLPVKSWIFEKNVALRNTLREMLSGVS